MINSKKRSLARVVLERSALKAAKDLLVMLLDTSYFDAPYLGDIASDNRKACLSSAMEGYPRATGFGSIKADYFDRMIATMCSLILKEMMQGRLLEQSERLAFVDAFTGASE